MSAVAALAVATALAGCGTTTYFAGRTLPPSGLANRVLIAVQNPGTFSAGALEIVDAFYDIRFKYNSTSTAAAYTVAGFSGALPISIQNLPEELNGAVYNSGSGGSMSLIDYANEKVGGSVSLNGAASSVFVTRNLTYVFAANQASHVLTVANRGNNSSYPLSLPGVYRVSVNPGGSVALAFVQNSNYVYYPRNLTAAQTIAYAGGPSTWPTGAVDCEPQNAPGWCLFEALSPDDNKPLVFDRPIKAVFSNDGGTAYILNCGPECGGSVSSISAVSVAPLVFTAGQQSGSLPTHAALAAATFNIPGGASNALVDSSTMYVVGQEKMPDGFWGGQLTVVNLPRGSATSMTKSAQVGISDGAPGAVSRMILADDDTLWIGMTQCTNGERANNKQPDGCLSMVNTTSDAVTLVPYNGDATGIAAVTGLHKIYTAEGGQIYIYSTVNGTAIDNQYVTVTGTAYDVAYMDALTDSNNTVY
ncbi:MAG: hypothetical protein ABSB60_08055 [Terracidiphilus sp.]|jgi:hypothetical protein